MNETNSSEQQVRNGLGNSPKFEPFISSDKSLPEFRFLPLVVGVVLGMLFGASSLYLVLKVGMTVSASIPVAVISIALFRALARFGFRKASILENNIVQTAGSAGESIAFGVGATMPAILILGFDLDVVRVTLVALLGGVLGILMMIPLRRALIVAYHGKLKYPEGAACAEVLKAGALINEKESSRSLVGARTIITGFAIGFIYKTLMAAFKFWKEIPCKVFGAPVRGGTLSAEISPELLGVGYIIGPKTASIMFAGGLLSSFILTPMIMFFGQHASRPISPGTEFIEQMSPSDVRNFYILYIGAGAVAAGGLISLARSAPIIIKSIKQGLGMWNMYRSSGIQSIPRTEQDIPLKYVFFGIAALIVLIILWPSLHMNIIGALLIVLFGFLFSTVSSRLTGEIGSSSNPISGMTVATILFTCLIFLFLGWTSPEWQVTALFVGAIVCVASSNAGTTSQDLKTGFLLGATPRYQQFAILAGSIASALILGPILLKLNETGTVIVPQTTFEKIEKVITIPREQLDELPEFIAGSEIKGGPFKLLKYTESQSNRLDLNIDAGKYLITTNGVILYKVRENFSADLIAPTTSRIVTNLIKAVNGTETRKPYRVWHKSDTIGGPAGQYIVDDTGRVLYYIDPGINGIFRSRPDGKPVQKFDAPKATLMSYIIRGILSRELPWDLVILGVMISIMLELSGIPSLAFSVGVYLPISSSAPIFVGGLVRFLTDLAAKHKLTNSTTETFSAGSETDSGPGVLVASGYIAGGALAGVIIALMAGFMEGFNTEITNWSTRSNPFFGGAYQDILSLIPFALIVAILYFRGKKFE